MTRGVAVVNIRCGVKGCRRLLLSLDTWPESDSELWSGSRGVWSERCPKHLEIRSGETISDADERRTIKGLPPVDRRLLMVFIPWPVLRPFCLDATHRGRSVDYMAF